MAFQTCGVLAWIEELDSTNKIEKVKSLMTGNDYGPPLLVVASSLEQLSTSSYEYGLLRVP